MAQDWPPGGGHINYNANDEQVIQIQGNHSTAPPAGLQGQLAPRQGNSFDPSLTGPDDFFVQYVTCLWRAEGHDTVLGHDNPSSPDLTGSNFPFPLTSNGIESSQAGICRVQWPPNGDLPTAWPIPGSSVPLHQSPVEPSAAGHLSRQDWSDFNSQGVSRFPFGGDEHSEAVNCQAPWPLLISPDFPTSWSTPDPSPQSPVGPSPPGHLSSQGLTDINPQGFFQIPLGGSEHSQPGQVLFNPPSRATGLSTSYLIIDSSPQPPVGPSPPGHLSSQGLTDINPQGFFPSTLGGNGHSQSVLFNPPGGAAGSPTSYVIIGSSPQSPVGPSPSGYLYSTDISPQGPSQFGENEHSQPGDSQVLRHLLIPPSGAAGPPMSSTTTTPSSAESPVGHPSSQDLTDINPHSLSKFGKNKHSQLGNSQALWSLHIPPSGAAGPPTSSTTTTASSAQSPVGFSAAMPHVTTKSELRTVGSKQNRKASSRRRQKAGIHQCPYCDSTFTEPHNLQYHINGHLGLKPYKCGTCGFASAYPLGQHMKRHNQVVEVQFVP